MYLYICYHNPFGDKGGGSMASHAYFRAFCDYTKGELDLICSSALSKADTKNVKCHDILFVNDRNYFQKCLSVFNGYMNRYVNFTKQWLLEHKEIYDTVVFDANNIAGPLVDFANKLGMRTITIHHNYEKEYFSDNNHGLYKLIFLHHVIKWEAKAYKNSSLNLFLTKQDMHTFSQVYGHSIGMSSVIGAFEFVDYVRPYIYPKKDNKLTFVITGSLGNYQTTDAIAFFFNELYQYMPTDCIILVAGRNPSPQVVELCKNHDNVKLIANPNDMNRVVSQADIYICATRIGGGLKLRVMDGLKNGLPVITHSCSARGFDIFEGFPFFKIYNTPAEYSQKLTDLLSIYKSGSIDKKDIQDVYESYFSYMAGLSRLRLILDSMNNRFDK